MQVGYKPRIDRWVGRRDDGVWFMASTEDEVWSFDHCACKVGHLCVMHEAMNPKPVIWQDVRPLCPNCRDNSCYRHTR